MDVEALSGKQVLVLWIAEEFGHGEWLAKAFPGNAWIAAELHCGPNDRARLDSLQELSRRSGLPLAAAGDVHMHLRSRRRLQDLPTAIRPLRPVNECRHHLHPHGGA